MAYSVLNACAADSNGIGYELDNVIGITANGCGAEDPYDFSAQNPGYSGLAWKISNARQVVLNSPYMIQNINVSALVTGGSRVTINQLYEGSPGNINAPAATNHPTTSLQVDPGCTAVLHDPMVVTPMSLAAGTATVLPPLP